MPVTHGFPFFVPCRYFPSSLLSTTAAAMTGHAQKNVECICTHNGERKERREREELSKPRTRIASHTHRILPIAREKFPIQKIPLCFFPPRPTVARQQRRPVERCGHKREREKQTNIQIFLGQRERDWEKRDGDEARQQETPLLFLPTQLPFLFPQYALSVNKPQKLKMILFQTSPSPLPHSMNIIFVGGEEKKRQGKREFSRSQNFLGETMGCGCQFNRNGMLSLSFRLEMEEKLEGGKRFFEGWDL